MDEQSITTMLAVSVLVLLVPTLFLARSVARRKVSRRASAIARELGLEPRGSVGSKRDPLLEDVALMQREGRQDVAAEMRGDYQGHPILLADVRDRPLIASALRPGAMDLVGLLVRLLALLLAFGFLFAALAGGIGLVAATPPMGPAPAAGLVVIYGLLGAVFASPFLIEALTRGRSVANSLVIVFIDPVPGLPDFLLEPRLAVDGGPIPGDEAMPQPLLREYLPLGGSIDGLPPAFLDRAARVLVGRSPAWTVQGVRGRLALWISNWHSPTNLRTTRTYRAVLDDAVSLRDALDALGTGPASPDGPAPSKSIRSSLERIRSAPGPNSLGSRQ